MKILNHETGIPVDPFVYPCLPWQDAETAALPQYTRAMRWMRRLRGRSVSLDFWARGNYARRLIANKRSGVAPLLVPVQTLGELRWAHRRLALLGLPVEFLWQGDLTPPLKVSHLYPGGDEEVWDAGWGYVATMAPSKGRRRDVWHPIVGYARLMPEAVATWLVDEAAQPFESGDVFVTPAELVGVLPNQPDLTGAFETVLGGAQVQPGSPAHAILNVELPALDRLTPKAFSRLLKEQETELSRVRAAFRKLVESAGSETVDAIVEELNYETSELTLADKYQSFRTMVTRLGGVITTTAAAVGAAVGAASGSVAGAVAAASASAAASGLCECIRLAADHKLEMRRNPLYLLWQLGSEKGSRIRKARPFGHKIQSRSAAPISQGEDGYFHWLAPPTAGVGFLGVRK